MRIFLASINTLIRESKKELLNEYDLNEKRYILCSFIEGEKNCKLSLQLSGGIENFLLDSGAFTFMNTKTGIKKDELQNYCEEYIKFINKYDIKYFFEMDVDAIFGIEYVEYLRNLIEKKTNKKCIPVWHANRGIEYWKKMCDNYDYIAIGGLVTGKTNLSKQKIDLIRKLTSYARKKNVKVHGLGFTTIRLLNSIPFYSVDSTSWIKIVAFQACLHKFDVKTHQLKSFKIPNNNAKKRINFDNCLRFNFNEWLKYQRYMDTKKW